VSPAYQLHPEFGLLCPSRSFRRKVWVVLTFLAVVALLASKASHSPDADGALAVVHDEARFNAETAQTVGEATGTRTADRSRPLEGSKTACAVDVWSYIDGKCSVGAARKLPRPRAANEAPTIAALPLGRSAWPTPESSEVPQAATSLHTAVPSPPVAADQGGASAPASKKLQKQSHRNSGHELRRDWRWRDDHWSARAYALPEDRYRGGYYERAWGWGPVR
jgi:hypothetical protein